jgi:nucleolar protein 15
MVKKTNTTKSVEIKSDKIVKDKSAKKSKVSKSKDSKSKTKTMKDPKSKTIKKTEKKVKDPSVKKNRLVRRFNKLRLKPDQMGGRGIVYIGHLPKGFEENELKKFFEQFGKINKMRVSRSKKTARTRGYAFVEFASKDVAKIAVQTMNGYMLFHK